MAYEQPPKTLEQRLAKGKPVAKQAALDPDSEFVDVTIEKFANQQDQNVVLMRYENLGAEITDEGYRFNARIPREKRDAYIEACQREHITRENRVKHEKIAPDPEDAEANAEIGDKLSTYQKIRPVKVADFLSSAPTDAEDGEN